MAGRYIPTDVLFNILVRLPASSLQGLKYVSKEWFHTISDPDFAEAHFAHQSQEEFGYNVLLSLNKNNLFIGERLLSNPKPPRRMNLPGVHWHAYIHSCCKGLVLFQCGTILHVANPITGDRLSLPPFYGYSVSILSASLGCGCDGKLKVVVVGRRGKKMGTAPLIFGVLTLGCRAWREMQIPVMGCLLEPYLQPCVAGGALHWIYDTGILSLDLGQENFHKSEVTFCDHTHLRYHSRSLEWDGCFPIFIRRRPLTNPYFWVWVWVLKKSGWTKLPDIDLAFFERLGLPSIEYGPCFAATARNGETILFSQIVEGGMHLFAYDLRCGTMTKFTEFDRNFFLPYLEQGYWYSVAHTNSMISCSSCNLTEKIGVCDFANNFFAYLGYTVRNLFGY